jgi:hypothetical protein
LRDLYGLKDVPAAKTRPKGSKTRESGNQFT